MLHFTERVVTVLRISHCEVRHTPIVDCIVYDEAKGPDELLEKLQKDFPDLTEESHITIVRFERTGEVVDV